jgi:hypothetical protein
MGVSLVLGPVYGVLSVSFARSFVAWGVAVVSLLLVVTPVALRVRPLRYLFRWTDAMSLEQRAALAERDLRRYYQLAGEQGYADRLLRYLCALTFLLLCALLLPYEPDWPNAVQAVVVFIPVYLVGSIVLMLASAPVVPILRRTWRSCVGP